jgi:hypothetical protein
MLRFLKLSTRAQSALLLSVRTQAAQESRCFAVPFTLVTANASLKVSQTTREAFTWCSSGIRKQLPNARSPFLDISV